MADIQGTSLNYFIYVCIVQASLISTTLCTDHHVFMVSILSEINYFATLVSKFIIFVSGLSCLNFKTFLRQ